MNQFYASKYAPSHGKEENMTWART